MGLITSRIITLLLGALLTNLIATKAIASPSKPSRSPASDIKTCKIVTGYGTAIGRGKTQLKAKENAREICGEKLIDQYYAQRQNIPEDAVDDLALACVNLECQ